MARVLQKLYPDKRADHTVLIYSNPWELTVAVILSARTTDKKVNEVTKALFNKYPSLESYATASPNSLARDIGALGFFNSKAKYIVGAARKVREEFGGVVPRTMEEMLTLPGVARKTANVVLWNAYKVIGGIPVDTHVRRLALKFDLTDHTDPVKIEKDLMKIIPQREWPTFSHRLVLYGREICPSRKHNCTEHPLSKLYPPAAHTWPKPQ